MSPILKGITASQISGHLITNSYEAIASVSGNGSANTLTIPSIPQTYKILQIRATARDARSTSNDTMQMYFNSDSASSSPYNYTRHGLRGTGSVPPVAYSVVQSSNENIGIMVGAAANTGTYVMGSAIVDIVDYSSTNKSKTIISMGGHDNNGNGYIDLLSSIWNSSSAITSITFINNGSSAWTSSTKFSLYGIK